MRTHKNIIVTLQYNKWELTDRFLSGILLHEGDNIDRIIAVDNGSTESNWLKLLGLSARCPSWLDVYPREKNEGFTLGANYGLRKACEFAEERDLIFLISNDVEINGPFIKQAEEYLLRPDPILLGNRHINWDSGWNTFSGRTFDYLEGFFLATTKLGWQELYFFDPTYAPFDAEDMDLSTKAKSLGYRLVSLNNPNIVHQNGGTIGFNPEREAITKRNREYFKNKWAK